MTEQPDPVADFGRTMKALSEIAGRVAAAYIEADRPLLNELARIAALPEVRAEIRRREALKRASGPRSCHCLCGLIHPLDRGVRDVFAPVTTVRRWSLLTGDVDVPTCGPCAAASAARRRRGVVALAPTGPVALRRERPRRDWDSPGSLG